MPEIGIIQRLQGEATDNSLPRYYPADPWLDIDTVFLFDAGKTASWPSQANPVHTAPVINLVAGGGNSVIGNPSSTVTFREGGFALPGTNGNHILVGSETAYELATLGNPDVLYIVWIKRETGYSTGSYQCVMGRGVNTNVGSYEHYLNLGLAGNDLSMSFSNGTVGRGASLSGAPLTEYQALLNTTMQLAYAQEGGTAKLFVNGSLKASSNYPPAFDKPYNDINNPMYIGAGVGGNAGKFLVKRWGMTKLGTKTAAQRVLQDYNANVTRMRATD